MSPSDTIHLVIEGATQATEIELQDASYHPVSLDQNAGRAEAEVRPGIYKVTYREGDSLLQENVWVTEETKIVRQSEGAPLVSAIPIVDSPTSNEWQRSSAEQLSRQRHFDLGGDAGLFVFVRDVGIPSLAPSNARPSQRSSRPEWPQADRIASGNVATGLTLRSADGAMLYDYAVGPGDLPHHWAGAAGRLPSGTYLLRVDTATGDAFELPVAVRPGWQTQVFSFTYSSGERDGDLRADLSKTSVAMARQGQGFVAGDPMLRIGVQALQALARRREIRSRELDSLLASEHQNPILGIVGAHLLRLRFDFDRSHFQRVVDVLFNLTQDERQGPHPDVAALRLERDDGAVRPFDVPPMLKRSWALLQVESHRRGEVVPEGIAVRLHRGPHVEPGAMDRLASAEVGASRTAARSCAVSCVRACRLGDRRRLPTPGGRRAGETPVRRPGHRRPGEAGGAVNPAHARGKRATAG